ncbi:unnamed protein product [Phytophthora fragariaefolia]|uniref:Unnamed protein product n=1 Tax=Phytophthora fragariaefolia TaxID=1490495 RepID=A0A9W6XT83_9STRA|nr:unnamed protein product [Phytophthora fragariaefolia]
MERQGRQVQVLLTLLDGERSFGMSLAQKSPAVGTKYTVVSSVFANSPADRAGVRKGSDRSALDLCALWHCGLAAGVAGHGTDVYLFCLVVVALAAAGYVVRYINDKPMNGLTVAQVANHFRNESRVVENTLSPRTSAFTAAATFGGVTAALPNAQGALRAEGEQRQAATVTGFSAASSGRAIAAPGTALAMPRVASPKQPVLRLSAKPAAKTLTASQSPGGVVAHSMASAANVSSKIMPKADAKAANGGSNTGRKSKAVAPVLRLAPTPKPVPQQAAQKVAPAAVKSVEPKPAAKSGAPEAKAKAWKGFDRLMAMILFPASAQPNIPPASSVLQAPVVAASKSTPTPSMLLGQTKPASVATATENAVSQPSSSTNLATAVPTPTIQSRAGNPALPAPNAPAPPSKSANVSAAIVASTVATTSSTSAPATVAKPATAPAVVQPDQGAATARVAPVTASRPQPAPATSITPKSAVQPRSAAHPPVVNQTAVPARSLLPPAPVVNTPRSQHKPARTTSPKPAVPAQATIPPRSTPPPPVVTAPRPQSEPARTTIPASVRSPTEATTVARSAAAPVETLAASTPTSTRSKKGKKRARPRKNPAPTHGTTSRKGKGKAKKPQKHQGSDEASIEMDDGTFKPFQRAQSYSVLISLNACHSAVVDDVFGMYAFSSESDLEESPTKKTARRAATSRRRGVTDRNRHSLTVDRLVGMGFTQEDAEASVREIGDDPDACMIWIISKIEERQFTRDLNEASIQSEQSKRDEETRVKKVEMETLAHAEKFISLFPTSYIACPESTASNLKKFLHSTIDQVDGETYIRKIITSLLTLEGKSIRWYKQAVRSYMLELAGRLDDALGTHDVMSCCARVLSANAGPSDVSCKFIRKILEEEKALTKALFDMPTNQGGVAQVFLECDETTKFDLEDDGFEVVEPDT